MLARRRACRSRLRTFRFYGTFPDDLWRWYPAYAPTNGTVLAASVTSLLALLSVLALGKAPAAGLGKWPTALVRGLALPWPLGPSLHEWAGIALVTAAAWHASGAWPLCLLGLVLRAGDGLVRSHRSARAVKLHALARYPPPKPAAASYGAGQSGGCMVKLVCSVERYKGGLGALPPWLRFLERWFFFAPSARRRRAHAEPRGGAGQGAGLGPSDGAGFGLGLSGMKAWSAWEPLPTVGPGQFVFINCPEVLCVFFLFCVF